jgi:four helix bundle protein
MKTEDLEVFKMSHEVVLDTYKLTRNYTDEEKFGLVSQMRRSSSSVPMNIMEGAGRRSTKEYIHFLSIASGSCEELKYHLG